MSLLSPSPDLAPYRDRHRGGVAWVFGSGPTLDAFLAQRPYIPAEDTIFALNEAAHILPAHGIPVDYAFAADPVDRYAHALPPRVPLFIAQDPGLAKSAIPYSALPANTVPVPGGPFRGTITLAGTIAKLMGIRQLTTVGIDGGPNRAHQAWLTPPSIDRRAYSIIRDIFAEWARANDMPVFPWRVFADSATHPELALNRFVNRHPGALTFLFGKGTSLGEFLAGEHPLQLARGHRGPVLFGFLSDTVVHAQSILSAAAAHLEDAHAAPVTNHQSPVTAEASPPLYCFANDSIARWHHIYADGDILFQPRRTVRDPSMPAPPPGCPRVIFEDTGGSSERLRLPLAERANHPLVANHGTCDSAAQILAIMGVTKLIAVGCDGRPGRTQLTFLTHLRDDHVADYASIRTDFERILRLLGLTTEFYGEKRILSINGREVLRITDPTVFRGQSVPVGSEFPDATDREVDEIVGARRGERIPALKEA